MPGLPSPAPSPAGSRVLRRLSPRVRHAVEGAALLVTQHVRHMLASFTFQPSCARQADSDSFMGQHSDPTMTPWAKQNDLDLQHALSASG